MKRPFAIVFLLLALGVLFSSAPMTAGERLIPSTDTLPLGDWTYDAMIKLASDGLVPGYPARIFEGDKLFNRMEMAQIVASIIESSKDKELGSQQVMLINELVAEFKPELRYVADGVAQQWASRETNIVLPWEGETFLTGYVRGLAVQDTEGEDHIFAPHRITGFSHLSGNTFAVGTAADMEEKFFHQLRHSQTPDKIFIRGFDHNLVWSIGREYLNWGPSYSGSLILSDNSSAFVQGRVSKELSFGKLFGRVKIAQFASVFEDDDKTLYLFGRRYEKQISERWHLGISETAKMNEAPSPLILVMPFYLYQHIAGGPGSDEDQSLNALYAADLTYRTSGGAEAYGELLVDDITAPKIFGSNPFDRPRKTGYIFGYYTPKLLGGERPTSFRAEYIFIDRRTYEATRAQFPELAYTHNNVIIGSPIGPNAKALYLRSEKKLSEKWSIIAEYLNQKQVDSGTPLRGEQRIVSALLSYDIAPDKSISVRVAPYKITPSGKPAEEGTKYELRASIAF